MGLQTREIHTDFCVVGGGIAGVFAAVSAARCGTRVVLMQERPTFGGNASSEIRMWICGAQQTGWREGGLGEELNLANYYYNPGKNHYLFDTVLYDMVQSENKIVPLLNCTCFDAVCEGEKIRCVTGYQMSTQTIICVYAKVFADCSGDSILAPLTGARFMRGREAPEEYGEYMMHAHAQKDDKTMGNSLLIAARDVGHPVTFRAPGWARKVPTEKLKNVCLSSPQENFWYLELGGNEDTVRDAETINRRLLSLALGVWDTIKNSGHFAAHNYELDFLGFLPAKRESRRMKGDYVLTANDILSGGHFPDTVAYGGWGLDDHNPDGFDGEEPNHNRALCRPYGIPYRALYSENRQNLFFAGRNISATHMAMSSARVMGTCGCIGQAVGVAAALACRHATTPRGVGAHMDELQQTLLWMDCLLPGVARRVGAGASHAVLHADDGAQISCLRDGTDRDVPGQTHAAVVKNGVAVRYTFAARAVRGVKIVFDSDFERVSFGEMDACEKTHSTRANVPANPPEMPMPATLAKAFTLSGVSAGTGKEQLLFETERNLRRNVVLMPAGVYTGLTLTVRANWGGTDTTRIFTFEWF